MPTDADSRSADGADARISRLEVALRTVLHENSSLRSRLAAAEARAERLRLDFTAAVERASRIEQRGSIPPTRPPSAPPPPGETVVPVAPSDRDPDTDADARPLAVRTLRPSTRRE